MNKLEKPLYTITAQQRMIQHEHTCHRMQEERARTEQLREEQTPEELNTQRNNVTLIQPRVELIASY